MLVLSRKEGEEIVVGDNIKIVVTKIVGGRVSIGIEAPKSVKIVRSELPAIVDADSIERNVSLSDNVVQSNAVIKNNARTIGAWALQRQVG